MSDEQKEYDKFHVHGTVTLHVNGGMVSKGPPSEFEVRGFLSGRAPRQSVDIMEVNITEVIEAPNSDITDHYE